MKYYSALVRDESFIKLAELLKDGWKLKKINLEDDLEEYQESIQAELEPPL